MTKRRPRGARRGSAVRGPGLVEDFVRLRADLESGRGAPVTLEEYGALLGAAIGREPFSPSKMSRLLLHGRVTDELIEAYEALAKKPSRALVAASNEEAEWFHVGRELLRLEPDKHREVLAGLRDYVSSSSGRVDAAARIAKVLPKP